MEKTKMHQTNRKQSHTRAVGNESMPQNDDINESEWQQWQNSYSARRRKTFADIVEALKKRLAPIL
jgi:hypothetical protein